MLNPDCLCFINLATVTPDDFSQTTTHILKYSWVGIPYLKPGMAERLVYTEALSHLHLKQIGD